MTYLFRNLFLYLKKHRLFFLYYFLVLCSLYVNFIFFYAAIEHPLHSPVKVVGPVLFTLINCIFFSLPYFFFNRPKIFFLIYLLLIDALLTANVAYYNYYGNVIPFLSYVNVGNLFEFADNLYGYFSMSDFIFFLPTISLFIFHFLIYHKKSIVEDYKIRFLSACAVVAFCVVIISANFIQDKINGTTSEQKFFNKDNNQPGFVSYYGILPLWIYQIYSYLNSDQEPLTASEIRDIKTFINGNNIPADITDKSNRYKNLIILLVESLDSWTLKYDNGQATPFLSTLTNSDNVIFIPNVLPQVKHGRSADAQLIINTGLLPVMNNTVANLYTNQYYPSLVEALVDKYYSLTVMGNKSTYWNQKTMNSIYHIDTLISYENLDKHEIIGMGISDKSVFNQTSELLTKISKPFYCQIITLSSHDGIDFKNYNGYQTFPEKLPDDIRYYIKSIHYVDESIRYFIDELKNKGLYDNSVIIITGDHNSSMFEDLAKSSSGLLNAHEIANKITFTPLFIINSGYTYLQRPDQVMGEIDIYPTILDIMGLNDYFWKGIGNSVFSATPPDFAIGTKFNCVGDTLSNKVSIPRKISAWRISDMMIRKKYFNTMTK